MTTPDRSGTAATVLSYDGCPRTRHAIGIASVVCLVAIALAASALAGSQALAVYASSFWHYPLYWWAYRYGSVDPRQFRRDAVVAKSVALAAFFAAYAQAPWSSSAMAAMAAGFGLNALAARVLGPRATYYGWELGVVALHRVTRFPFSVVPHPMLLGNVLAYAGALLNPVFRHDWWPLALAHVVLNLGLLVMEVAVVPQRGRVHQASWWETASRVG